MRAIAAIRSAAAGGPRTVKTTKTTHLDGATTEIKETRFFQPEWVAAAWLLERRFPEDWSKNRQAIRGLYKAVRELQEQADLLAV